MSHKRLTSVNLTLTPSPDVSRIELKIEQQVVNTLATYEANRNNTFEQDRIGNSIHGRNNDVPRLFTYEEFLNYQPRAFYDNHGFIGFTLWIKKMESIFKLSSCAENYYVKFSTCTFMNAYLTWWNNYTRAIGIELAYATT